MTPLYFVANSLSDATFETYLKDTQRYLDYRDVRQHVLPGLFASFDEMSKGKNFRFVCANRFEGQHPAIRIQSPVGFVPDQIWIEFPARHESFRLKHSAQELDVQGLDKLESHLRVLLVMGFAHWSPK
jgi:hypothetical protein